MTKAPQENAPLALDPAWVAPAGYSGKARRDILNFSPVS